MKREVIEEMARFMMMEILYDNGCINRLEPEEKFYDFNNSYVPRISLLIDQALMENTDFEFTQERLELLARGGIECVEGKEVFEDDHELLEYKNVPELWALLDEYFVEIPD